jgi:sn-glycerol 3-phosphate transport system permease protein
MQIPPDLREAAQMDGLGHWGFMKEVAIPLVRPTLGALGLFSFLSSWNQYLWPSLITTEDDMNTVQTGLRHLASSDLDKPNLIMAGTIIAAVPILIVLVVFQKQLVRGLTAGAVKG